MLKGNASRPHGKTSQKGLPTGKAETTTLPTIQIENLVRKCVETGKKYDEALALLEAERLERQELEAELRKQTAAHDVQYLESALQAAEQELHELEAKCKVQTALLALYQSKLKNVTDMFRYYELTENESKIRTAQLQRDLESMESLVADQKLSIETIEKSSIRASAMLQQEQQNKHQMQSRIDSLQQQLLDRRQDIANLEANTKQQEELIAVKDQAYARLEERYVALQEEAAALRSKALVPVGVGPAPEQRPTMAAQPITALPDNNAPRPRSGPTRAVNVPANDTVQSVEVRSTAASVAEPGTDAARVIYYTESRNPSGAVDLSYGAMFASPESSMLHDASFQSSVRTVHSKPNGQVTRADVPDEGESASPSADTSQQVSGGIALATAQTARPRGTPSDPAWRSALDPTPMKRKSRRPVPSVAAPGDPLHSVLLDDTVPLEPPSGEGRAEAPLRPALRRKPPTLLEELSRRLSGESVPAMQQVALKETKGHAKRNSIKKVKSPSPATQTELDKISGDMAVISRSSAGRGSKMAATASRAADKGSDRHRTFDAAVENTLDTIIKSAKVCSTESKRESGARTAQKIRPKPAPGNSVVPVDTVVFSESLFGLIDL